MEIRAFGSNIAARVALVALGIAAGGCGKSEEVELADFGEQAARTTCDKVYECCMPMEAELAMHMRYGGGRATCGSKSEAAMGFWAAVIGQEQERGRLAYDARLARRCLESFAAATCEGHKRGEALDGCDRFITPKTAPGAPCSASESCLGGACVGQSEGKDGVCRAFASEGGSCADGPCAKGLYCDGNGKICRSKLADGAACRLHAECRSEGCNGRDAEAGTPGTCGLRGGEQTRCFVTTGCAFGGPARGGAGTWILMALVGLTAGLRRARGRRRPPLGLS
jgi:hypothetical protein